ncbi:MAG: circadian clock protein KaiB [Solirubrobacteraceae bacterium]|nr:circadian clock protein KaiB [Solirubrobacteraceae bacterium]
MTRYHLTLFVSGASERSSRAIADATAVCHRHLSGDYQLSVVDVHDDRRAAATSGVLAVPTLVRNRPLPTRRITGDLSNAEKVLLALQLPPTRAAPAHGG